MNHDRGQNPHDDEDRSNPEAEPSTPHTASGEIVAREPRIAPRLRTQLEAQLSTLDPDDDACYTLTSATTRDVADGGLGLSVDEPMTVGQRVVVEVELADGRWVERKGRIAWTSQDVTGERFAGIAFDAVVSGFAARATSS